MTTLPEASPETYGRPASEVRLAKFPISLYKSVAMMSHLPPIAAANASYVWWWCVSLREVAAAV